ncbi:Major Facilitator Superfamily protein [Rhodoferax sp. OV413]|uniref:MFS transporter n=1 Tax=Rhodoferax sp. OV413 TaxID=1855285 RepID=UPI000884DBCF|nr:MFS transporter [Rhodoferax sp. OV413]SDP19691.1 Major Facilitator Superfamily protein [Rhodoferax sp. OV413]
MPSTSHPLSAGALASSPSLSRQDVQTLGLSALGGTLEFYDFVIYVFFAAVLSHQFFPVDMPDWLRQLQTFGIFAAGYLSRPLGGIVIAHFGDLLGRKRMFTLSIFLMAVPTLVIGLLPTYASIGVAAPLLLLAMRVLQGAAIGGEMPGAWVFVAEHVPPHRYGLGVGTLTAGITGGILLGSLVAVGINTHYSPADVADFAWRIPFILGGVFGLVSVYLRRFLHETPVFQQLSQRRQVARELPLKTILREHRAACLLVGGLTWVLSAAIVVVVLITPNYLQKVHGIAPALALEANAVATLTLTLGCVLMGWACDRIGTRAVMLIGFGGLLVTSYLFYTGLPGTPMSLVWSYGLVGFFVGVIATVPIVGVRAFPAAVRFSGLSFAYNLSYAIFGGMTPIVLTLWLQKDPLAPAYYVGGLAVLGMLLALVPLSSRGFVARKA